MQRSSYVGCKPLWSVLAVFLLILLPLVPQSVHPADKQDLTSIHGVVVGDQGAIAGAVVRIQTTKIATTTGSDGRFTLQALGMQDNKVSLTAWAPGYYCGGPSQAYAGQKDVIIPLRPVFKEDNPDYRWLSGSSNATTEEGEGCAACHSRPNAEPHVRLPVEEWLLDAHSKSAVNPIFLGMYQGVDAEGNQSPPTRWSRNRDYGAFPLLPDPTKPYYGPGYKLDFPHTAGNCGSCHVPLAAVFDPFGVDPTRIEQTAREGVTCDFCHKIWDVRLDPKTGLPQENMPGVLSFKFRRPSKGHQFFAGPFDDVAPGEDTYSLLMRRSEICAPCHFGKFWDTEIYNSFGEWKASPYSNPDYPGAKTCQDCHMPRSRADHFALPEKGGLRRDPGTIATHLMAGISDEHLMRNAAALSITARKQGDTVQVEITVTNDRTGHHLPTDSPMRQVILVVDAHNEGGGRLALADGPVLPKWAGDLASLPGRAYAKILEDIWTKRSPTATYWNPTRIISDTRLAAFSTDTSRYSFHASGNRSVIIKARLIYRRTFQELAILKKWKIPDLEMSRSQVVVDQSHLKTQLN